MLVASATEKEVEEVLADVVVDADEAEEEEGE